MTAIELADSWKENETKNEPVNTGLLVIGNDMAAELRRLHAENELLRKDAVELLEYMTAHIFNHVDGGIVLRDLDGKDVAANWLPKAHKFIAAAIGEGK